MWRKLLLAAFLYIVGASSKPMKPIEETLWFENPTDQMFEDNVLQRLPEFYEEQYIPETKPDIRAVYDTIFLQAPTEKRALAMFGRWGPINNFGKERSSIRSIDKLNSSSNRKLGQPFRWG